MARRTVKQQLLLSLSVSFLIAGSSLPAPAKKSAAEAKPAAKNSAVPSVDLTSTSSAKDTAPDTIRQLERRLFFKNYPDEELGFRVTRIEKHVFGEPMTASLQDRITRLEDVLRQQLAEEQKQKELEAAKNPPPTNSGKATDKNAAEQEDPIEKARVSIQEAREKEIAGLLSEGVNLFRQKRGMQAQEKFEQVLRLDPTNAQAHFNLGIIEESMNNYVEALASYKQALHAEPDNRDFADAVSAVEPKASKQHRMSGQRAELRQLAEEANDAWKRGEYMSALDKYLQLDQKEPDSPLVKYNIGSIYLMLKDQSNAVNYYKQAHKLAPGEAKYSKAYNELSASLKKAGKEQAEIEQQAINDYKEANTPPPTQNGKGGNVRNGQQMTNGGRAPMRSLGSGGGMQQNGVQRGGMQGGNMQRPGMQTGMQTGMQRGGMQTGMQQGGMQQGGMQTGMQRGGMQQGGMPRGGMNTGMGMQGGGMNTGMGMQGGGMNTGMGMQGGGMNTGMGMQGGGMNTGMGMQGNGMNTGMGMQGGGMNTGMGMRGNGMNTGMGMQGGGMNTGMGMQGGGMNNGMGMQGGGMNNGVGMQGGGMSNGMGMQGGGMSNGMGMQGGGMNTGMGMQGGGMNTGMGMQGGGMNTGMGMQGGGMNNGMGMQGGGMNTGMGMQGGGMNTGVGMQGGGMNTGMGMQGNGMNNGMGMQGGGMSNGMGMQGGIQQNTGMGMQGGGMNTGMGMQGNGMNMQGAMNSMAMPNGGMGMQGGGMNASMQGSGMNNGMQGGVQQNNGYANLSGNSGNSPFAPMMVMGNQGGQTPNQMGRSSFGAGNPAVKQLSGQPTGANNMLVLGGPGGAAGGGSMSSFGISGRSNGEGVTVTSVGIASRAQSAGLMPGDDIKTVDGTEVTSTDDINRVLSQRQNSGDKFAVVIMRKGNLVVLNF